MTLIPNSNESNNPYKFGIFYYDPNDKRVFVPKRIKYLGWTLNFANPISYAIMAIIIVIIFFAVKSE